jgi:hypothetical protein
MSQRPVANQANIVEADNGFIVQFSSQVRVGATVPDGGLPEPCNGTLIFDSIEHATDFIEDFMNNGKAAYDRYFEEHTATLQPVTAD